MPPHIFAISDNAYNDMLRERHNQSMLITGESGAGKTVNTKRVIQYFAVVAALGQKAAGEGDDGPSLKGGGTLEDQIVAANPAMEAFGNAKTTRNDNSSRFGKFIRIHFGLTGKLASGDIDTYLLEKSRVVFQLPAERCFHIFYQICTGHKPDINELTMVSTNPYDYKYCSLGEIKVKSIDDREELDATDSSFDILGFNQDEKNAVYRITAGIMHSGNMEFKQKPREEQAENGNAELSEKAAFMLGISGAEYAKALCSPRVKVGSEYVVKGQTVDQVYYALGAICKAMFERLFNWLVAIVNRALSTDMPRSFFIGILDIAGFEIFEFNTFEQLCINFTNEKLQQFFNHHMFVLEQEEYKKEGIEWTTIDFGMDLAATIDLIEKPLGIMSILEEECMFPKATDMTFKDKLFQQHLGKNDKIGKAKPMKKPGVPDGHFELYHYAGTVSYNVTDWLTKNKDPLNGSVVGLLKKSTMKVCQEIWASYISAEDAAEAAKKSGGGKGGKRKKGGSFQTVSALHRESLGRLMTNLRSTQPHFVRCIIPNEIKKPGYMDWNLVLHQLRCNGVLEGIRICRKGYPSRVPYEEFVIRYVVLTPQVKKAEDYSDWRKSAEAICKGIELEEWKHRFGNTKMFFKAGIIGDLEDTRDEKIAAILTTLQSFMRYKLAKKIYDEQVKRRDSIEIVQANIRAFCYLKDWEWMKIIFKIKPLISQAEEGKKMAELEKNYNDVKEKLEKERKRRIELEELSVGLKAEREELAATLEKQMAVIDDIEGRCEELIGIKIDLDTRMSELQEKLDDEEELNNELVSKKRKLDTESTQLKNEIEELETTLTKVEKEKHSSEMKTTSVGEELAAAEERIKKLTLEKGALTEQVRQGVCDQESQENKFLESQRLKSNLEQQVDNLEMWLQNEKKIKLDLDRQRRKLEGDMRLSQEMITDLENEKAMQEEKLKKCEIEYQALQTKMEDEAGVGMGLQKRVKELQAKLEEIDMALDQEQSARIRSEKIRADLSKELEDLAQKLEVANAQSEEQLNITKEREAEAEKLQKTLDDAANHHNAALATMRGKQAEQMESLKDQTVRLQNQKHKLEKDKSEVKMEVDELTVSVEILDKSKKNFEKQQSTLKESIDQQKARKAVIDAQFADVSGECDIMMQEINELRRQIEEKDAVNSQMVKNKNSLIQSNDELKRQLEEETKGKNQLSHQLQTQRHDTDMLRQQLEEEQEAKSDLQRNLSRTNNEVVVWRNKYETDAVQRNEELEEAKKKLVERLHDSDEQVEAAQSRCESLEKAKTRLQGEVEDLTADLEKANGQASALEKKQRSFDAMLLAAKQKQEDAQVELDSAQKELRSANSELLKLRNLTDEVRDNLDGTRKSNKVQHEEITELQRIVAEGSKQIHELEKEKRKIDEDRNDLQGMLLEAEAAIANEENKFMNVKIELSQLKQESERKISAKDEEIDVARRNATRSVEQIQASLDSETRSRVDAGRSMKKMESDLNDLEVTLATAKRQAADAQKNAKDLTAQLKDLRIKNDEVLRSTEDARENSAVAERRVAMMSTEIDELRRALEQADRSRKQADNELMEANERSTMLHTQNTSFINQKKKIESELTSVKTEVEEAIKEARSGEEAAKRAMTNAALLAEDLKKEQDQAEHLERMKKNLESNVKDLQKSLEEAEQLALKGGRRSQQKLEARCRELEGELESETSKSSSNTKQLRKLDRKLKETIFANENDKKNLARVQAAADKLDEKMKGFKKMSEEKSDEAAALMTKFRKLAHELDQANERAEMVEAAVSKARAKAKEQFQ